MKTIYTTLNDIDRRLGPPVDTIRERLPQLLDEYSAVGARFGDEAETLGMSDRLRFAVSSRAFSMIYAEHDRRDEARRLFKTIEECGYPDINPLISLRMNWADTLTDAGEVEEARRIGRLLITDIAAYRERYPRRLSSELDDDLAAFRHRLDI